MNASSSSSPAVVAPQPREIPRPAAGDRNGVWAFFGVQADEVQTLYQRAAAGSRAAAQLDDHLRRLNRQRSELAGRCQAELDQRRGHWQETESAWRQAAEQAAARNSERDRLAAALSSFWYCLGLLVRRWFWRHSPDLNTLRERLRTLSRESCEADRRFDELAAGRKVAEQQWRELATPLESLDFALTYLQQLRAACRRDVRQCLAAVDQEIQDTVRGSEIAVLIAKCRRLAGALDPGPLLEAMLLLKQALLGLDVTGDTASSELQPLDGTPADRLSNAIEAGFVWRQGTATGDVQFQGEGRRQALSRPDSLKPGSTSATSPASTRQVRRSHVEVNLTGSIPVTFEFRLRHWTAAALAKTLAHEARYHFQLGLHHPPGLQRRDWRAAIDADAARWTAVIRQAWERAAFPDSAGSGAAPG